MKIEGIQDKLDKWSTNAIKCQNYDQFLKKLVNLNKIVSAEDLDYVGVIEYLISLEPDSWISSLSELFLIQKLTSIQECQTITLLICKKITILQQSDSKQNIILLVLYLSVLTDMLKKSKKYCPELISGFLFIFQKISLEKKIKVNKDKQLSQLIESVIFQNTEHQDFDEIIIQQTIKILNHSIQVFMNESNFDVIFENILNKLEVIQTSFQNGLIIEIINKIKSFSEKFQYKNLHVLSNQPILKIKQLTPKIKDEELEVDQKQRIKLLKKDVSKNKKLVMKQLKGEQKIVVQEKNKMALKFDEKQQKNLKKLTHLLDQGNQQIIYNF